MEGQLGDARARTPMLISPGAQVAGSQEHKGFSARPEFESLFPYSLASWMTSGDLLNLIEHQPLHVANEDNHIYLPGLSEDAVRACDMPRT